MTSLVRKDLRRTAWEALARWSPVVPDRALDGPGPARAGRGAGEPGDDPVEATVLAAQPPALLEHRWGLHRLRWTLAGVGDGTDLELRQWLADRDAAELARPWDRGGPAGWPP